MFFHLAPVQSSRSLPERAPLPQQQQSTETKERQPQNTYFNRFFPIFRAPGACWQLCGSPRARPTNPHKAPAPPSPVTNPHYPPSGKSRLSTVPQSATEAEAAARAQQEGHFPATWPLYEFPYTQAQPSLCSSFPFDLQQTAPWCRARHSPTELPTGSVPMLQERQGQPLSSLKNIQQKEIHLSVQTHTHTRAPPPLRTKVKDETMKSLMGNVILLLDAHPSVFFQAPDHSCNWDSDLWLWCKLG